MIAFMGRRASGRKPRSKVRRIKTRDAHFLSCQPTLQPQRMVVQHADHIPCFAGQQTRFQGDERHRVSSLNHRPRRRSCLCEQTRRNIQRDHRRGVPVGVCNERSNVLARRAAQAGAQQTINNQINILWPDDIRRMNHAACIQPCLPRRAGLFRQRFITFECQQRHADPRCHRKTGNHVTVTAVIAVSAHY